MERIICLDGVEITLDVDKVEVDLRGPHLLPTDHQDECEPGHCHAGERWQPIMSYDDGTTVYLHCPPEGEDGHLGYRVAGPRPHRWTIAFLDLPGEVGTERVAHLSWDVG